MKHAEGSKAWAIAQMLDGKKVTHMGCKTDEYFYMGSCGTLWDESDDCFDINIEVATGWRIVEEPKPEEYLYLWRYKNDDGNWNEDHRWLTPHEVERTLVTVGTQLRTASARGQLAAKGRESCRQSYRTWELHKWKAWVWTCCSDLPRSPRMQSLRQVLC